MHIVKRSCEILLFFTHLDKASIAIFKWTHIRLSFQKQRNVVFFDDSIYYTSSSSPTFQRPLRYEKLRSDQSEN